MWTTYVLSDKMVKFGSTVDQYDHINAGCAI